MTSSKIVPLTCHGHSRPVPHLAFSSLLDDNQYCLISACKDNNPMLRDGITGDWIGTFVGHKGAVWHSQLSSNADLAATGSADFTAKVWDTYTGECLHTLQHNHIVRAVAFAPGPTPTLLATGGFEKKLRIFDLASAVGNSSTSSPASVDGTNVGQTSAQSWELGNGHHGSTIKSIIWGPEPNTLITAADDKTIRWWDMRQQNPTASYVVDGVLGSCELNVLWSRTGPVSATLAVGAGKTAYFFSASSPAQLLQSHRTAHDIASVAVQYEAQRFVVGGSNDTWVRVYDLGTGAELNLHKGHHGPVWSTSFAPDGKLYATGSEDGTIKLWKFCSEPYGLWK